MIKKIIFWKFVFLILFFSLGADAALQWKVGAFLGSIGVGVAVVFGLAGAAPIVVAGALAVGVHAAVIGLYWDDISSTPPRAAGTASKGLSVVIDANTPLVVPAGWSQGSIGDKEPVPPSAQTPKVQTAIPPGIFDNNNHPINATSVNDAKLQLIAILTNTGFWDGFTLRLEFDNVNHTLTQFEDDGSGEIQTLTYSVNTDICKAGYTLNTAGDSCTLTDATKVVKPSDNVCEVRPVGGVFKAMQNDPDCANTAIEGLGTASLSALAANKAVYLATSSNGTVTVYDKVYDPNTNNTSLSTVNFNPTSDVDFIQTANSLGNTVTVNPVGAGSGTGTGTSGDAAKDSSLNVKDGGDEPIVGNGNATTGGVLAPPDALGTSLNPLRNWAVPSGSGACPTGSVTALGKTLTFDTHCALFDANMPVIRQAFGVVFSLSALFIVLGA